MHHAGAEPSSEPLAWGHRLHQNLDKGLVAGPPQREAKPALKATCRAGPGRGFASWHRSGTATAGMSPLGFLQPRSLHGLVMGSQDSTAKYPPPAPSWQASCCHL